MAKRGGRERILFLSEGFLDDPRIAGLTDSEFRAWVRVLTDQLRFGNGGSELRSPLAPRRQRRYLDVGLLEQDEEGRLHVHAWDRWNGREAWKKALTRERVRRHRARRALPDE